MTKFMSNRLNAEIVFCTLTNLTDYYKHVVLPIIVTFSFSTFDVKLLLRIKTCGLSKAYRQKRKTTGITENG